MASAEEKRVYKSDRCAQRFLLITDGTDQYMRARLWTFESTPWRPGEQGAREGNPEILGSTSRVQTSRWHPSIPCSEDRYNLGSPRRPHPNVCQAPSFCPQTAAGGQARPSSGPYRPGRPARRRIGSDNDGAVVTGEDLEPGIPPAAKTLHCAGPRQDTGVSGPTVCPRSQLPFSVRGGVAGAGLSPFAWGAASGV